MVIMTVIEERDFYRDMLRKLAENYPSTAPAYLSDWWATESALVASQRAEKVRRKAEKAADLAAKIADLQTQLASLA
jgi:type III secretory pathway lipoprotein EscJ